MGARGVYKESNIGAPGRGRRGLYKDIICILMIKKGELRSLQMDEGREKKIECWRRLL